MTQTEALKLALALVIKSKRYADECSHMATQADIDEFDTVATAIKEALAQPEQLEGLQLIHKADIDLAKKRAIEAQPAVAEQHKQEPVAWMTTEVTTGTQVWLYKKTAERYQNPPIPLYTHPRAPKDEQVELVALTNEDFDALERFNETCEDGEGYDVPKSMMRRLAEKGAVYHTSRGIYGITSFGQWLLKRAHPPVPNAKLTAQPKEPEQEPAGLIESLKIAQPCCGEYETCWRSCTPRGKFLGQRDAQRTWVGLTEQEAAECWSASTVRTWQAIEAKLKEKNT